MSRRLLLMLVACAWSTTAFSAPAARGWELKLRDSIFTKLDYDRAYFERILALNQKGKSEPGLTHEQLTSEVARASAYSKVLTTFAREKEAYVGGTPFTLVAEESTYRTYSNLIAILNLLLSFQKEDYAAVLAGEKRVVLRDLKDLGVVRGESVAYQLALQRQYFYLLASANFHLGTDAQAIAWMSRLGTDEVIKEMKKRLAAQTALEASAASALKSRVNTGGSIVAVLPFVNVVGNKDDAWMVSGAAEALATDLPKLRFTVVERARLNALLAEREAARAFASDEAQQFGKQLGADFVVMGSLLHEGQGLRCDVRFVDVRTGVIAASVSAETDKDFMELLRALTLAIAAHFDQKLSADTVGQLVGSKRSQRDFEAQTEDPNGKPLAVMPFENLGGEQDAQWLSRGLPEVLTADLTRLTPLLIVERSQIAKVLNEVALSQSGITDEKNAAQVGQLLNARWLILGSYKQGGGKVILSMRVVDAKAGKVVEGGSVEAAQADLFKEARRLALELVGKHGLISAEQRDKGIAANAPKTETVRELVQAQSKLPPDSPEAKALVAKALREDPENAGLIESLKADPKAGLPTVALLPFMNLTGNNDEAWLAAGAVKALTNDLPRLRFAVVEAARVKKVVGAQLSDQVLRGGRIAAIAQLEFGKQLGADLVAMGSVTRRASKLRAEVGFIDVRTGATAAYVSVEATADDFMGLLTALSMGVADRFNQKLSKETLNQLVGTTTGRQEFEKQVREQLGREFSGTR